jgi:HSP20 family protein
MTLRKVVPSVHATPKKLNIHTLPFDNIDQLFDNFFNNNLTHMKMPAKANSDMAAPMNVSETEKQYLITMDLPGLSDKDIDLELIDDILTVSGERSCDTSCKDHKAHRIERSYGSFKRSLALPSDADQEKIKADMKHGVLTIQINKLQDEKSKPRKISIKSL